MRLLLVFLAVMSIYHCLFSVCVSGTHKRLSEVNANDFLLIVRHMYFFPRYIITFASISSNSVLQSIEAYFLNWITSIFCNEITWQYRYNYQLPHERGFFVLFCFLLLHLYSNTDKKLKNDFKNFVVKTEIKNKSSVVKGGGLQPNQSERRIFWMDQSERSKYHVTKKSQCMLGKLTVGRMGSSWDRVPRGQPGSEADRKWRHRKPEVTTDHVIGWKQVLLTILCKIHE